MVSRGAPQSQARSFAGIALRNFLGACLGQVGGSGSTLSYSDPSPSWPNRTLLSQTAHLQGPVGGIQPSGHLAPAEALCRNVERPQLQHPARLHEQNSQFTSILHGQDCAIRLQFYHTPLGISPNEYIGNFF